jgi:two-component system, chemotaxis family, response regulator PixG
MNANLQPSISPQGLHAVDEVRLRVLFVDASESAAQTAQRMLLALGCECRTASDGLDALCAIARQAPDVLLIDLHAVILDGVEVCLLIKNHQSFRHIRVYLMATQENVIEQARASVAGAEGMLMKPSGSNELARLVGKLEVVY